jgi:hypothetical protein
MREINLKIRVWDCVLLKKLVEDANGSIKVDPVKGGGTAFVFLWPATFENAKG